MNYNLNHIIIYYKDEDPYYEDELTFRGKSPDDALGFIKTIDESQFIGLVIELEENRVIHSGSIDPLDYEIDEVDDYKKAIDVLDKLSDEY
jgi:hypothetical protein